MALKTETVSPLLSRIQKQEPLSLKNLAYYIPLIRAGRDARAELESNAELTHAQKLTLLRADNKGNEAKETLVLMALPLVTTIARKEFNRRMSWSSRVSFDDMVQEGMGGFLRGIEAYNVEGTHTSPTNYLGQWILSDIRRHVEKLDHDFSIPHETIERHRKIRAIRSFLYNKLGRNPSDEEILEHANSGEWQPSSKMGKVKKDPNAVTKELLQKHLDEERDYATATGRLESITGTDDEDDQYERPSTPLGGEESHSKTNTVEDTSASASMSSLFERVFKLMELGDMQEDIIRQKFGLPPHKEEISLADISKKVKVSKYKVNQVVTAFSTEMAAKGSIFHKVVSSLPEDEVDAMGMGWVLRVVGPYEKSMKPVPVDAVLTSSMKPTPKTAKTHFGDPNRTISGRWTAEFNCDKGHKMKKSYFLARSIPDSEICSTCGENAGKGKVEKIEQ